MIDILFGFVIATLVLIFGGLIYEEHQEREQQDMFESMLCSAYIPAGTILVTSIKCTDGNRYRRVK